MFLVRQPRADATFHSLQETAILMQHMQTVTGHFFWNRFVVSSCHPIRGATRIKRLLMMSGVQRRHHITDDAWPPQDDAYVLRILNSWSACKSYRDVRGICKKKHSPTQNLEPSALSKSTQLSDSFIWIGRSSLR
ncbi:Hypothetical protein, putative [Bodo saltans]|uniref:Uncharacterized protein n=1 Tax=Bodo saltans TaxID=75058 RepID=A0A0S4IJZ7_BODSA|nr:Hypothetical protein, putative [Bodo saltans]|eukprot:CUE98041.1 Hypothetical protein, putative [Bodo saltans]